MKSLRFWTYFSLIVVAVVMRLIPHPSDFSPIAALALFAGAQARGNSENKWMIFTIPFVAMLISDMVLGFHNTMWAVYLSFALITLLGLTIKNRKQVSSIALNTFVGATLFFVVTNFAVWMTGGLYTMDMKGLSECFVAALPFFDRSLLGDVCFVTMLFGGWHVAESFIAKDQAKRELRG